MSVKVTYDVAGLKELETALKELGSEVAGKNGGLVRAALMNAALPVWRSAQAMVPEKTGTLKKQIKRSRVPNARHYSELVTVGVPLPQWEAGKHANLKPGGYYGKFIEMGTRRMPARPFLRPAMESNRQQSINNFRKNLATGIERVAKKIGHKNAQAVGARIKKL